MKNGPGILIAALILFILPHCAPAQGVQKQIIVNWSGVITMPGLNYEPVKALCAKGLSNNSAKNYTPEYSEKLTLPDNAGSCDIKVINAVWEPVSEEQLKLLTYPLITGESLQPHSEIFTERGVKMVMLTLVPVIANPAGGILKLKSFTLDIVYIPSVSRNASLKTAYATHSLLAQGNWYKIKLDKTGIYKITYSEMQSMGIDMSKVTPLNIRLFGNGGGMLPEANTDFRIDDLAENPVKVVSADPETFVSGDYILFYGTAPDKVFYNRVTHKFEHSKHIYSDFSYYFLNFDSGEGARIENLEQSTLSPNYSCTSFTEGVFYEKDLVNFISSGKEWVGERLDAGNSLFEIPEYTFPNLIPDKQSWIRYRVTAKATKATSFTVYVNGLTAATPLCPKVGGQYQYATERIETKSFFPQTDNVKISFQYNGEGTEIGWLDWVELNIPREMKFTGGQMAFADPYSVMPGYVTEFLLQGTTSELSIWEVTNPLSVKKVIAEKQGDISRFVLETDSIRQFVAWDNTSFLQVTFAEKVANQDLHGIASADLLIVTHNDFLEEANRLANHHRTRDGMNVAVVTNEQVYNEFSSGSPDIAAIRDFARMLYTRPETGGKLKYLLLFGDGSYDFKDRIPGNTNRVLTYQTKESMDAVSSYVSDDFYGLLDENEGLNLKGLLDIGIGRFPVNSPEQAKMAVDKCIFYATNTEETMGDWRNRIALISDDGNGNIHFGQAEYILAPLIEEEDPVYNLNKGYTDAYVQVSTPGGERCPDVNEVINTNVENGVLVMNYTGHGGETGWTDEAILTVRDIDAWTNYNNMPVFMTATCEFGRYDDPVRVSAGEHVFLNPVGGGIALFTTTRLASPMPNIKLNEFFYDTLLAKYNGEYPRFGDVIAYAKNMVPSNGVEMTRNFTLLGDPALRLAYPQHSVITTEINGQTVGNDPDTISAMTPVEIKGIIADAAGNKIQSFTGFIDVIVFDKPRTLETLGSDPQDYPDTYTVQDNYIYQGRASVTNGDFTVSFIVPRDIDYSYGFGKISYYAHNTTTDANGYSKQIVIGGSGNESQDVTGPGIALFMNDLSFKDGGITGETPLLIAQLNDESGINTTNSGIGHEITATLDGDNSSSVVLNSYYSADLDSYQSGEVRYKLPKLTEGMHSLTLKAWDVFNNSSEATITFKVTANMQITITGMNVFPNPFSDEVNVEFDINLPDTPIEAHLEIYNINGSFVSKTETETMLSEGYKAGVLTWDGRNASGSTVAPGVYLVSIRASNANSETVKAGRLIKLD